MRLAEHTPKTGRGEGRAWLPVTALPVPVTVCVTSARVSRHLLMGAAAAPRQREARTQSAPYFRRAWPLLPLKLPLLEELVLKLPLPLPTVLGVTIVLPEASEYAVPP